MSLDPALGQCSPEAAPTLPATPGTVGTPVEELPLPHSSPSLPIFPPTDLLPNLRHFFLSGCPLLVPKGSPDFAIWWAWQGGQGRLLVGSHQAPPPTTWTEALGAGRTWDDPRPTVRMIGTESPRSPLLSNFQPRHPPRVLDPALALSGEGAFCSGPPSPVLQRREGIRPDWHCPEAVPGTACSE